MTYSSSTAAVLAGLQPTLLYRYLVQDSLAAGLAADQAVSPEEMRAVIPEVCSAGMEEPQWGVAAACFWSTTAYLQGSKSTVALLSRKQLFTNKI